ncbi:MAG: 50S ribosomal protein L24 [Candidatus Altiarchaeota archaeon]|nr:50S ribosomal protein L24 [Candidatus Altiarchaeota archaeon]
MKGINSRLGEELRTKYKKRNTPIRTGDKVKVKVGQFKGNIGKVLSVISSGHVTVEGLERSKADGSKIHAKIHASNVQIIELVEDKWRKKILKR